MQTKRFLILSGALVLVIIATTSFAVANSASPKATADTALSDYWQRHPAASIPVTGIRVDQGSADWYQRHRQEFMGAWGGAYQDYAARHPDVRPSAARNVDLTDYAARHPGLSLAAPRRVDTTDYYFRHLAGR